MRRRFAVAACTPGHAAANRAGPPCMAGVAPSNVYFYSAQGKAEATRRRAYLRQQNNVFFLFARPFCPKAGSTPLHGGRAPRPFPWRATVTGGGTRRPCLFCVTSRSLHRSWRGRGLPRVAGPWSASRPVSPSASSEHANYRLRTIYSSSHASGSCPARRIVWCGSCGRASAGLLTRRCPPPPSPRCCGSFLVACGLASACRYAREWGGKCCVCDAPPL